MHCYRILGSLTDAEDMLQETLIAAWHGLDSFAGRASVRTWLYRIATNRCLNQLRGARRRRPAEPVPPFTPPKPTRRDEALTATQQTTVAQLAGACSEMTALAGLVGSFAALLRPEPGNDARLGCGSPRHRPPTCHTALLRPRPGPRPASRRCGTRHAAPQRPHRGRQHEDQADQTPDVRPRRLRPATPPDPAELTRKGGCLNFVGEAVIQNAGAIASAGRIICA